MSIDTNDNSNNVPVTDPILEQLRSLLASHEARLSGIERRLGLTLAQPQPPEQRAASTPRASTSTIPQSQSKDPSSLILTPKTVNEAGTGRWLGAIAVVCFVLAAGFIVRLSIESGWLTPERQLGLATLFGLALIGGGFWLSKSDREYASLLPGAGIIVLYVTAFSAHRFYSVLSLESALIAISVISAFCIWIYTEVKHDLYPLTAAVGSYFAPLVLNLNSSTVFTAYYFLICSAAFATVSVWVSSRTLAIVASYLAISTTAVLGFSLNENELIAALLAIHLIVFAFGTVLQTKYTGIELTERAAGAYFPVLVLFYATEYYFISKVNPNLAPWCSMGFAAFLIALYLIAKSWAPERSLASRTVILGFTSLVFFHSGYLELLPAAAKPWLLGLIFLIGAFLPQRLVTTKQISTKTYLIPTIAIVVIVAVEYVSLVYHLMVPKNGLTTEVFIPHAMFTLIAIWTYIVRLTSATDVIRTDLRLVLIAAHVLAVFGFYNIAKSQGSLAVSAAWLIYAVAIMAFAFRLKDEILAKSALVVLGLAAAKALLYDASSAPALVRIFCLILTGAVLYGAGFLMRRISNWKAN